MFLKILALVKVVDEFDLKILANLVNILNNDDTKVRALRASVTRTIWAAYGVTRKRQKYQDLINDQHQN